MPQYLLEIRSSPLLRSASVMAILILSMNLDKFESNLCLARAPKTVEHESALIQAIHKHGLCHSREVNISTSEGTGGTLAYKIVLVARSCRCMVNKDLVADT